MIPVWLLLSTRPGGPPAIVDFGKVESVHCSDYKPAEGLTKNQIVFHFGTRDFSIQMATPEARTRFLAGLATALDRATIADEQLGITLGQEELIRLGEDNLRRARAAS